MTIPASDWPTRPISSGRVARIQRAPDPDAAVRADACRQVRRLDRRTDRVARRIARDVRRHHALGDVLRHLEHEQDALDEGAHVTGHRPGRAPTSILVRGAGGRPLTASQAAAESERLAARIDAAPDHDHHGTVTRLARAAGGALLGVDVVALFLVFARLLNLDWTALAPVPLIGASVFSIIGAGTMGKIAYVLGDRLWVWRRSGTSGVARTPARGGLVAALGVALAVLSVGTGSGILLRILDDAADLELGLLGPVLAVVVGGAGAVAPWIIVTQRAHDGTELTRALRDVARIVSWTSQRRCRLDRRRDRALARRRRCRERALMRINGLERAVGVHRRRHEEIVARAAGATVTDAGRATFDAVCVPLRDQLQAMDRAL